MNLETETSLRSYLYSVQPTAGHNSSFRNGPSPGVVSSAPIMTGEGAAGFKTLLG